MKKVLVLTNSLKGLFNFRKELMEKLIVEGFEVFISAPKDEKSSYFINMGCEIIETYISRRGTDPITDFKLLLHYLKIIKRTSPNVVLTYTIKPNVYGGLACRLLSKPYITNITGLGTSIESKGVIQKVSLALNKIGLKNAECVFFQNDTNRLFFTSNKIVKGRTRLIPGSGVNIVQHRFEEYPENNYKLRILFIGRIMKAKGIYELFEAIKQIKGKYPNVQFDLIGDSEEDYSLILTELEKNKLIKYHGRQNDVHSYIKTSHATINPSHHEGMSNVLLESASTGRPVLASNIPGCKETFDEGITGLGFEVKSVNSLVDTLIKFIELPYEEKRKMGFMGRIKIEKEFDRNIVINAYLEEISRAVSEES